jgi:hypothetical protein
MSLYETLEKGDEIMDETNQSFSVGIRLVKSGKENDFIAAWGDFAKMI